MDLDTTDQAPFTDFATFVDEQRRRNVGLDASGKESGFITRSALREYWVEAKIARVTDAVFPASDYDIEAIRSQYLQTFSALVYAGAGSLREMLGDFLTQGLDDSMMPVSTSDEMGGSTEKESVFQQMAQVQWVFYPLYLNREVLSGGVLGKDRILPVQIVRSVKRRDTTNDFMRIHDEYNLLVAKDESGRPVQDVFLFKSFRGESSKLKLESEVKAYAVLLEMENLAPNIATCYGSFTHNGSHTIVLESANAGDLAELYEDQKSPETLADILQFWKSLSGILRGLAWVHERGIHQNLSPRHVVLSRKDTTSPFSFIPKLTGFDHFAEGHRMERGDDHIVGPDTSGDQLYSSPDAYYNASRNTSSLKWITDKADIFSLGTIFSDTIAWIKGGSQARQAYFSRRFDHHRRMKTFKDPGYEGCFHDGFKLLDVVVEFHKETADRCEESSDPVTLAMVQIVDYFMLGRWERQRKTSKDLADYVEERLDGFEVGDLRMPTHSLQQEDKTTGGSANTKARGGVLKGKEKKSWTEKVARLRHDCCFST